MVQKYMNQKKKKYLGVIVDDKLTWKYHIYELRKKLGTTLGVLYQLKKHKLSTNSLKTVYYSLFQSYLTYGIALWGHAHAELVRKIEILQNKAIRIIKNLDYQSNTDDSYKELNILKVEDLKTHYLSVLMWQFNNGDLPTSFNSLFTFVKDSHKLNLRSSKNNKLSESDKINT